MVACVGRAKAASGRLVGADKLVSTFPLYIPALEKKFPFVCSRVYQPASSQRSRASVWAEQLIQRGGMKTSLLSFSRC